MCMTKMYKYIVGNKERNVCVWLLRLFADCLTLDRGNCCSGTASVLSN